MERTCPRPVFVVLLLLLGFNETFANVIPRETVHRDAETRLEARLREMTLSEKLGQLLLIDYNVAAL
ncbi:MAG TPA: hypothetical protein PLO56_16555, partial [Rhodothermales bacterium]|nr:hypothetical protein [Rhodothermales bacterium]